ncbi:MAG: hypothetical protein ACJ76D_03715 [Solirubrobacterales bacterium]
MKTDAKTGPLERMAPRFAELAELSLDALPGMFDAETGLFSHKTTIRDGRFANREPNVLYSAVSLVGILRQRRRAAEEVLPLGRALDGLHAATAERARPGETGNFVWAATIAEDGRGAEMSRRLAAVDPATCPSGELGQVLYGLVCAARAYEGERDSALAAARRAAAELRGRFSPRAEVFRTSPRARRLPRRELLEAGLASFAAQVYPLHGLAALHLYTGEAPPPELARVAGRIVEAQGPLGQWWWIYSSRSRVVLEGYPVYSVHQDGMAFLGLVELERLGLGSFLEPLALGLDWIYGANELRASLIHRDPPMVFRNIQRAGSDADGPYGVSKANLWRILRRSWMPGISGDATEARPRDLEVLEECRSYHLGWLLYADSLVQEAEARRDSGGG